MAGVTSFGHANGEGAISLGTEAWNIADGFTKIKILRLLIEIDLYEVISQFGYKDLDDPSNNPILIPARRYEALKRVLFDLQQLIGNCRFSIDDKADKKIVSNFFERLSAVEEVIESIADFSYNDLTKENEIRINEDHFKICSSILRDIKDELNFPINRAGLIFRQTDEVDLEKFIKQTIEGG